MTQPNLTIADAVALGTILDAAQRCVRVRWLLDSGDIAEGVARCIAHDGGGFLNSGEDVRDGFLHVSGIGEQWLPVTGVMRMVARGEFVLDDGGVPDDGTPSLPVPDYADTTQATILGGDPDDPDEYDLADVARAEMDADYDAEHTKWGAR